MESSVVINLPVHGVIISMLYMIIVTLCIELITVCSRHCSSAVTDTCLAVFRLY